MTTRYVKVDDTSKDELRQKFLAARRSMSPVVASKKSGVLARKLIDTIDWSSVRTMHCFLPLQDDNEPDLRPVIEVTLEKGVVVYTSDPAPATGRKVSGLHNNMQQQLIKQYDLSYAAEYGLVQFDLIILPMLAYDPETNQRLGFGGGYYDRLLAHQSRARKIGVCFSEFAVQLPSKVHDKPFDEMFSA